MRGQYIILMFSFFASVVMIPFSPVISILFCVLGTLFFPNFKNTLFTLLLLFVICFNFSVIYSAKDFYGVASDFPIYFQFYNNLVDEHINMSLSFIFDIRRFEPFYYILTKILTLFFGYIGEVKLSVLMNFLCLYLLSISIYIYSLKYRVDNALLLIVMTVFIFKVGSITLFWRQSISAAFIILFLSFNGLKKYYFILLSLGFHFSSVLVAPISYFLLGRNRFNLNLYVLLIFLGGVWIFVGRGVLSYMLYVLGLPQYSFFINDNDFPYYMDSIKTVLFSLPILFFYFIQYGSKSTTEPVFNILLLEVIVIMAFSTVPHFFRVIYPISVAIISFQTIHLMLKLNHGGFFICFLFVLIFGFLRLLTPDLMYQFDWFSAEPFYFFKN